MAFWDALTCVKKAKLSKKRWLEQETQIKKKASTPASTLKIFKVVKATAVIQFSLQFLAHCALIQSKSSSGAQLRFEFSRQNKVEEAQRLSCLWHSIKNCAPRSCFQPFPNWISGNFDEMRNFMHHSIRVLLLFPLPEHYYCMAPSNVSYNDVSGHTQSLTHTHKRTQNFLPNKRCFEQKLQLWDFGY